MRARCCMRRRLFRVGSGTRAAPAEKRALQVRRSYDVGFPEVFFPAGLSNPITTTRRPWYLTCDFTAQIMAGTNSPGRSRSASVLIFLFVAHFGRHGTQFWSATAVDEPASSQYHA